MLPGETTLPFDLVIFAPSLVIIPWVKSRANGSLTPSSPRSLRAFMKKRAYSRWRIACSTPPMYWSTGIQRSTASRDHAAWSLSASQ